MGATRIMCCHTTAAGAWMRTVFYNPSEIVGVVELRLDGSGYEGEDGKYGHDEDFVGAFRAHIL